MSKYLAVVVSFLKQLITGRDTSHLNGDILFPGHVNFANKGGDLFHGSKVKRFFTLRGLNEWCMPGNGGEYALIAEVIPSLLGYTIIYTRNLSRRDIDTMDRYGREINAKIEAENKVFVIEEQEKQEKKVAEERETKRLAEIGRKVEAQRAKIKELPPGPERKAAEKKLNKGELDE